MRPKTLLDKPILFRDPDYKGKIVSLDIETAPSIGAFFNYYSDLNIVWKEREWFVMMMSHKQLGHPKIYNVAIWDFQEWNRAFCKCCKKLTKIENLDKAEEKMLRKIWKVLDKNLVVNGHNSDNFDIKKLNAKFIKYGFEPPSPYQSIDTLKTHKRLTKTDTNKLGDVGEFYNLGKKRETEKDLHRKCLQNDKKAQKEMKIYCNRDVELTEKLYLKERGWSKSSTPNLNVVFGGITNCSKCFSPHIIKAGYRYYAAIIRQSYKCLNCGARPTGEIVKKYNSGDTFLK